MSPSSPLPDPSPAASAVATALTDTGARQVALVGPGADEFEGALRDRGITMTSVNLTSADETGPDAIVVNLGRLAPGELRTVLSGVDGSLVVAVAPNLNHATVTASLLDGSWLDHELAGQRFFTEETVRAEIEQAGFLIDTLATADNESDQAPRAFVLRAVPHAAAAQVATARRRVVEVTTERSRLVEEIAQLNAANAQHEATRQSLEARVVELAGLLERRTVEVEQLTDQHARARQDRDSLRADLDKLRNRRSIRLANQVGQLRRRFR